MAQLKSFVAPSSEELWGWREIESLYVVCVLQVKDTPSRSDEMPAMRSVNVEFSRDTLDTMLDGLGKIRDQLSSVASQ